jgi:glycosyltransferase involved in cell wall biosynthesis
MQPIKVSVVLCTHNGERHLQAQLQSLAAQSLPPHELIVGDDCSTDTTGEIIHSFGATAPFPVRIIEREVALGPTDNFLSTASESTGDYVAFCDQDDVWLPQKLATVARAHSAGAKLVLHSASVVDERLEAGGQDFPHIRRARDLPPLRGNPWRTPPGFAMSVSRSLVDVGAGIRIPDFRSGDGTIKTPHDQWYYFLGWSLEGVSLIAETLVLYRQHGANVAGAPEPALNKVHRSLAGVDTYLVLSDIAAQRADLFDTALCHHRAAKPAAAYWRRVGSACLARADIYDRRKPRRERVTRIAGLALSGNYGRVGNTNHAPLSLAKDCFAVAKSSTDSRAQDLDIR